MGDMLSQAEIDALLNGTSLDFESPSNNDTQELLTPQEIDALGEIGNISMGTSATTLFTLLGHKVNITTPTVKIISWEELASQYSQPYVAVRVEYTEGLIGSNLLIMKEDDVKIITDLMMGGEGNNISGELTDLHLSAISEAMNQMIGSSATSMSSMFSKKIDISPPKSFIMHFDTNQPYAEFSGSEAIVKVAFKIIVGNLIDSEIMQLLPISFAKSLVDNLLNIDMSPPAAQPKQSTPTPQVSTPPPQQVPQQVPQSQGGYYEEPHYSQPMQNQWSNQGYQEPQRNRGPVNVQPAQFESFDEGRISNERRNISLIMDVPLQVTVELGRTNKLIREILEFGSGSIIELDKLAGEPIDILVNGKVIAKGEVVVIDESFGVRITDIIHPSKRL